MNKLIAVLLVTAPAWSFATGEVGASNPNSAANENVVAVAETGASASWTSKAFEGKATAHDIAKLNNRIELLNQDMVKSLNSEIDRKVTAQTEKLFLN